MALVVLKNGQKEEEKSVRIIVRVLNKFRDHDIFVFSDFVMFCHDSTHELESNSQRELRNFNLIGSDGRVHNTVRNIVQSAVSLDDIYLELYDPIAYETSATAD